MLYSNCPCVLLLSFIAVWFRHHCSSKIHRLRQVTGATHGNGKTFKKVDKVQADKIKDVK